MKRLDSVETRLDEGCEGDIPINISTQPDTTRVYKKALLAKLRIIRGIQFCCTIVL